MMAVIATTWPSQKTKDHVSSRLSMPDVCSSMLDVSSTSLRSAREPLGMNRPEAKDDAQVCVNLARSSSSSPTRHLRHAPAERVP